MSDKSKIRNDKDTGYPEYQKITDVGEGKHYTQFGGYSKKGDYYEGGHGENLSKDDKQNAGRELRKHRGD